MINELKDKLIVEQSLKIMRLEEQLSLSQQATKSATKGLLGYKEILHHISSKLKYDGDYSNLPSVVQSRIKL